MLLARLFVHKGGSAEVAVLMLGRPTCEKSLQDESAQLMRRYPGICLGGFIIMPEMPDDPDWRNKAGRWLSGETLSNQGRVRSDAVAPTDFCADHSRRFILPCPQGPPAATYTAEWSRIL